MLLQFAGLVKLVSPITATFDSKKHMDSEELIRRCEAISLKLEEDDMIDFAGKMKAKGEKIAAHCLIGKIYHTRGVSREGEKVESMGENIFIFKFALEGEKKRILRGGPWHFNNSLMVLT